MKNTSYTTLPNLFYQETKPQDVKATTLLWNESLAQTLEIPKEYDFFHTKTSSIAQAYMGHQFGHLTMLGDGRAVLLGEVAGYDLQIKGSGRTKYSRGGDGQASLGPMLREYVISEAMHALQIPTTRSLALLDTHQIVQRATEERGAAIIRVASSHLRVGTFQYARYYGTIDDLRQLADYAIERHFPELQQQPQKYIAFFRAVMLKQATLVAQWMSVGFVHGVMNTDNMTISGETIDYGPCAFMDTYYGGTVFSSIDTEGRYRYENQPKIAGWNLARFVEALYPLFHSDEAQALQIAQQEINRYGEYYEEAWLQLMREKIGLPKAERSFIETLLTIMEKEQRDFTETFRALTLQDHTICTTTAMTAWYDNWIMQITTESQTMMRKVNPAMIPRNHLVEQAIINWTLANDTTAFHNLQQLLQNPYAYTKEQCEYVIPSSEKSRSYTTYCGT